MIPKRGSFLPIAIPDISEEEIFEVLDCLRSGWISVGPKVKQFETEFARYHGTRHAIAVTSCTTALFLVAKVLGVKAGDYVVVPAITWPSTANIVEQLGATPLFVDVDRHTMNVQPDDAEHLLKRYGSRVRCIIPVHMSGLPVDIAAFDELSRRYGVPILYDAAHAVFSEYDEKRVGVYGDAACFSFYAIKNITTGDGGVITTNDDALAEQIRLWSYHGMDRDAWKRYSKEGASPHVQSIVPGYKFNMTDLNAALGLAQMRRADGLLAKRNELVEHYNELLSKVDSIERPVFQTARGRWGNHVYVIKLLDEDVNRDRLMQILREYNIGTNIHFHPVHKHYYYRNKYPDVTLPVSEWLGDRIVTLPLCTRHTEADIEYVVGALTEILEQRLAHVSGAS